MDIELSWTNFKPLIDSGQSFRYFNNTNSSVAVYQLFMQDGNLIVYCNIPQIGSTDQNDFVQNYIQEASATLTDGGVNILLLEQIQLLTNLKNEIKSMKLALLTIGGLTDSDFDPTFVDEQN